MLLLLFCVGDQAFPAFTPYDSMQYAVISRILESLATKLAAPQLRRRESGGQQWLRSTPPSTCCLCFFSLVKILLEVALGCRKVSVSDLANNSNATCVYLGYLDKTSLVFSPNVATKKKKKATASQFFCCGVVSAPSLTTWRQFFVGAAAAAAANRCHFTGNGKQKQPLPGKDRTLTVGHLDHMEDLFGVLHKL